jgi:hypothetical protein
MKLSDLSRHEREALFDIKAWGHGPFIWRPVSMAKLEARGLVERHSKVDKAWIITLAGLAVAKGQEIER